MADRVTLLRNIERLGEVYCARNLDWDRKKLESDWLKALSTNEESREQNVSMLLKLIERNPDTACAEAQQLESSKRN